MRIEMRADSNLEIRVHRADDETGAITLEIEGDDDTVTIDVGRFEDDAYQLADELQSATRAAEDIRDNWEDRPDRETDGWVYSWRDGYHAKLGNQQTGPFPSRDIATYELARLMADGGMFPNAWYEDERGGTDDIAAAVLAYHDEAGATLKPLTGVRYQPGAVVREQDGDWPLVVDADYGDLGVMLHTQGDPSVTVFVLDRHEQLSPADDQEGEDQ